jgi:hypothetical protein
MNIYINGKAIEELRKILEYPPYLIFVFVGGIFMVASIIEKMYFSQVFTFLLYASAGAVWRYIEKDFDGGIKKYICDEKEIQVNGRIKKVYIENNKYKLTHLIIISIYHIGNIVLFYFLLHYLNII